MGNSSAKTSRQEKLAQKLRENLRRRKQQAKARGEERPAATDGQAGTPPAAAPDGDGSQD